MPRRPTIHIAEPKEWYPCPIQSCTRKFHTTNGRTKHIRAKHDQNEPRAQTTIPTSARFLRSAVTSSPPLDGPDMDLVPSDIDMPDVSNTPYPVTPDSGFPGLSFSSPPTAFHNDDVEMPGSLSPEPSPPPSRHISPRLEPDDLVPAISTEYHPFINGEFHRLLI